MPAVPLMTVKDRVLYPDGWRVFVDVHLDAGEPIRVEASEEYLAHVLRVDPLDRHVREEKLRAAVEAQADKIRMNAGVDSNGKRAYRLG